MKTDVEFPSGVRGGLSVASMKAPSFGPNFSASSRVEYHLWPVPFVRNSKMCSDFSCVAIKALVVAFLYVTSSNILCLTSGSLILAMPKIPFSWLIVRKLFFFEAVLVIPSGVCRFLIFLCPSCFYSYPNLAPFVRESFSTS